MKLKNLSAILLIAASFSHLNAQKKNDQNAILKSSNQQEIETFLKTCHPDDPRKNLAKKRLVHLKNEAWTKDKAAPLKLYAGASNSFTNYSQSNPTLVTTATRVPLSEADEKLHKEKTVKLLNTLFSNDVNEKDAIILLKNETGCNLELKITGSKNHVVTLQNFAEDVIVLEKGQ